MAPVWRPSWVDAAVLDEAHELAAVEQLIRDTIGWAVTRGTGVIALRVGLWRSAQVHFSFASDPGRSL